MLELLNKGSFVVGIVIVMMAIIVGFLRYHLLVTKKIKERYTEMVYLYLAIIVGMVFTVFLFVDFYSFLYGMFSNSLIGFGGDNIMPAIYTIVPLLCGGAIMGVIFYEVAKYTAIIKKFFLKLYRKNHRIYIR